MQTNVVNEVCSHAERGKFQSACVTAVSSVLYHLSVHDHVLRQESSTESNDITSGFHTASQTNSAGIHHVSRIDPTKVARDIHAIATTAGSFLYQSIQRTFACLPFAVVIEHKAVVLHHRIASGGVSLAGILKHNHSTF